MIAVLFVFALPASSVALLYTGELVRRRQEPPFWDEVR